MAHVVVHGDGGRQPGPVLDDGQRGVGGVEADPPYGRCSEGVADQPREGVGVRDQHFVQVVVALGRGGEAVGEVLGDSSPLRGVLGGEAVEERHPGPWGLLDRWNVGHVVDEFGGLVHRRVPVEERVQFPGALGGAGQR